jgi:CheY-like chemotaxis protein
MRRMAKSTATAIATLMLSSVMLGQVGATPAGSKTSAAPLQHVSGEAAQASPQAAGPASNCTYIVPARSEKGGFWDGGGAILLGAIPSLIWAIFGCWAVYFLSPQIIRLIARLRSFKGFGIEMEFALGRRLEQAAKNQGVHVERAQFGALVARLSRVGDVVSGMRVLWVDDEPNNNVEEQLLLSQFGALIVSSENTADALSQLRNHAFDLVISDMKRGEEATAGLVLLSTMRQSNLAMPVIIYTGTNQLNVARPAGLFGITNRPDELIHLVLDARERQES